MRIRTNALLLAIAGLLALPSPAFAYLDPGTGGAILQGIVAALAAIGVALKLYWHKVLRFLGIRKRRSSNETSAESEGRTENLPS